jgi:AcrR family transcriptional regulator
MRPIDARAGEPPAAPAPTRNKRDPQERRAEILAAAGQLFAEFGFEQTSMRQIGARVAMLAGSLYHHFETKEDLLHEIIRDPQERMTRQNDALAQLPVDAELRLAASVLIRFHQFTANWHVHVLLTQESNFFRQREDFAYVQATKDKASRVMMSIIADGIAAGLFRSDLDAYLTIATISQMVSSAAWRLREGLFTSSITQRSYNFDEVIDYYLDCAMRLVRPAERIGAPIPRAAAERLVADCLGEIQDR